MLSDLEISDLKNWMEKTTWVVAMAFILSIMYARLELTSLGAALIGLMGFSLAARNYYALFEVMRAFDDLLIPPSEIEKGEDKQ